MNTSKRRLAHLLATTALAATASTLVLPSTAGAATPRAALPTASASPVAAEAASCRRTLATYPVLRPGAQGPAVRTLQCGLNDLGLGPVVVDGYYGPQTRKAVWQIVRGFEGQGTPTPYRIDNGFWTLLNGRQLPSRVLETGDRGQAVRLLQRALRAAGADIVVDGDFGPQVRSVVQAYQRHVGYPATGRVNQETRFMLGSGGVFGDLS